MLRAERGERTRSMKTPTASKPLRITDQVRTRNGYAYDIAVEERRLTISIESTEVAGGWRAEARGRDRLRGSEQSAAAEAGSRCEALRAVVDVWNDVEGPRIDFDWKAIEGLLGEVRAL
jgi:hypothetical protein